MTAPTSIEPHPDPQSSSTTPGAHDDLHSGHLYWPTRSRSAPLEPAALAPAQLDAVILGAGITGAFVAHALARAGVSVGVLDARGPGRGSTAASTALLLYELDTPLTELSTRIGPPAAAEAYLAAWRALGDLRALVADLDDDADLAARPSLHLAAHRRDMRRLKAEAKARSELGIAVEILGQRDLRDRFGINRPGALLSADAFEVDPLRLTMALLRSAQRAGAVLLPPGVVDASALADRGRPFRLRSTCSGAISARHVVIATGYETPDEFAEIARRVQLRSTYVVATEPLPAEPWPQRALLWDTGEPYLYARTTADGRVLIGGEDEPFMAADRRDALIPAKSRRLLKQLRELAPGIDPRPAFQWAGAFAQTHDGLPWIGRHRNWPDVHFALGYGGNGITFSLIAAQIIANSITGHADPRAQLFGFGR
ncbi:MAG: FAD-binding oxidoreductase [Phycisphaerales bacterium]|nr:FAD-binding oxidoreductase [Phycisphaerales bacterium]